MASQRGGAALAGGPDRPIWDEVRKKAASHMVDGPQIEVRLRVVRVDAQAAKEAFPRCLSVAGRGQRASEPPESGGIWRSAFDSLHVTGNRLERFPLSGQSIAEVRAIDSPRPVRRDGAGNQTGGQLMVPLLGGEHAQQIQRAGMVRMGDKDTPVDAFSPCKAAGPVLAHGKRKLLC